MENFCKIHSKHQLTFYCLFKYCNTQLCTQCIKDHILFHEKNDEKVEIEEFSTITKKIKSILENIILSFNLYQKDILQIIQQEEQTQKETLNKIKKAEGILTQIVFLHFKNLEKKINEKTNTRIQDLAQKSKQISEIIKKLTLKTENFKLDSDILSEFSKNEYMIKYFRSLYNCEKELEKYIEIRPYFEIKSFEKMSDFVLPKFCYIKEPAIYEKSEKIINYKDFSIFGQKKIVISEIDIMDNKDYDKEIFLHFFNENNKKFYYISYDRIYKDRKTIYFRSIDLKEDIPNGHKSICLNGQIYLLGGKINKIIYNLDLNTKLLINKTNMLDYRRDFSLISVNNCIYYGGGYGNSQLLNSCEKYDLNLNKCFKISSLNTSGQDFCWTGFKNKYIFSFGGQKDKLKYKNIIEKYTILEDIWTIINLDLNDINTNFLTSCYQINDNEILGFGGYYEHNEEIAEYFILFLSGKNKENIIVTKKEKKMNAFYLPPFSSSYCTISEKQFFCLQRVSDNNVPRIVSYDGNLWKAWNIQDLEDCFINN